MTILLFVSSCTKDINEFTSEDKKTNLNDNYENNGDLNRGGTLSFSDERLVFSNRQELIDVIDSIKDMDENEKKVFFSSFYSQGFIPLHPHYYDSDESSYTTFFDKKEQYLPFDFRNEELELDDPLISDDIFASLLNFRREVEIENKIYAYTFSGLLITDVSNEKNLNKYIQTNDLYNAMPVPSTLNSGLTSLTSNIDSYVNPDIGLGSSCQQSFISPHFTYDYGMNNPIEGDLCSDYGGGYTSSPNNPPANHTQNLINYVDDLDACNYDDAGIFGGFTPFGTRKVCYENFSGNKRRTKTLYSNENYYVYTAIQVKVKHQRHHSAWFITWWASKKTDEVALIIDQATFRITPGNMQAPTPNFSIPSNSSNEKLFYSGGLVFNDIGFGPQIQSYPIPVNKYPTTPFDEDVIVEFFNDNISFNQSMDITANDVRDIFWSEVWDRAKDVFRSQSGGIDPTRVTMLMPSQTGTIVHYVDLSTRRTDTKKIVEILDQDWGAEIKFNLSLNSGGMVITDPSQISDSTNPAFDLSNYSVEMTNLTTFDDIFMDFTGLTRRGSTWKGSKMVYKATSN